MSQNENVYVSNIAMHCDAMPCNAISLYKQKKWNDLYVPHIAITAIRSLKIEQ